MVMVMVMVMVMMVMTRTAELRSSQAEAIVSTRRRRVSQLALMQLCEPAWHTQLSLTSKGTQQRL
eukprot:12325190-Prorocentrum_lima.AAC.1